MDWTQIIMAVITAGVTIIGVILSNRKDRAVLEYRIDKLEEKVDIHNHYAEKLGDIEKQIVEINTKMEMTK